MNDEAKKPSPHVPRAGLRKYFRHRLDRRRRHRDRGGCAVHRRGERPCRARRRRDGGDLPIRLYGLLQSVTVGETETAPEGVTLAQIVAVLERAEQRGAGTGARLQPHGRAGRRRARHALHDVPDAAARVRREQRGPPRRGRPGRARAQQDARTGRVPASATSTTRHRAAPADEPEGEPGRRPRRRDEDDPPAVQVSDERTSVIDPHATTRRPATSPTTRWSSPRCGSRTCWTRRRPTRWSRWTGPGEREERLAARESLLDVVAASAAPPLGYANGRIPADVLCPLDFAPGHMLRCDAAERLTALSARVRGGVRLPDPDHRLLPLLRGAGRGGGHQAAPRGDPRHVEPRLGPRGRPGQPDRRRQLPGVRLAAPARARTTAGTTRRGPSSTAPSPSRGTSSSSRRAPSRTAPSTRPTSAPGAVGRRDPALQARARPEAEQRLRRRASKPPTEAVDEPSDNPPSQKPPKPTPKPTPTPTPTPSPTPTPTARRRAPTPSGRRRRRRARHRGTDASRAVPPTADPSTEPVAVARHEPDPARRTRRARPNPNARRRAQPRPSAEHQPPSRRPPPRTEDAGHRGGPVRADGGRRTTETAGSTDAQRRRDPVHGDVDCPVGDPSRGAQPGQAARADRRMTAEQAPSERVAAAPPGGAAGDPRGSCGPGGSSRCRGGGGTRWR